MESSRNDFDLYFCIISTWIPYINIIEIVVDIEAVAFTQVFKRNVLF
jgi:hypothetical protein